MLSAFETAAAVRSGKLSAPAVVQECLARIDVIEDTIKAWFLLDRGGATASARELDAAIERTGSLAGVTVGIKDIFDVAGLKTTCGAAEFAHRTPDADSTPVARLKAAGAIILGKTATTEFAYLDPAPTRNPWNTEHTPGGSSSGSAAAVAAGMVPVALGSQTVGSVLRPAAYCGVVGLKPTHGRIGTTGVFPLAPSLDHVGIFARSVQDAALVLGALAGPDPADPHSFDAPIDDYVAAATDSAAPPRIAWATPFGRGVISETVDQHITATVGKLRSAGATIDRIQMPGDATVLFDTGNAVLAAEAAASHAKLFTENGSRYRENIRGLIERGYGIRAVDYLTALTNCHTLRTDLTSVMGEADVLLLPVAPSSAPRSLFSTGNAIFCAPASYAGMPAISLPSGLDSGGLPLGIQLVAPAFAEAQLLRAAAWVERVLDFRATPPLGD